MGKTFVRGKENCSLADKKEPGELVENYKKEYDKEVKALKGKLIMIVSKKNTPQQNPNKGFLKQLFERRVL